jgi:hypothetical protein
MAWSRTRYGNPDAGPAFDTGTGFAASTRDPTLLMGAAELA